MKDGRRVFGLPTEPKAYHAMTVEEVLGALDTGSSGLKEEEARLRLAKYGYNQLPERKRITALQILLRQFKSVFVLMLVAASLISALFGETVDAITIGAILLLMAIVGFAQDYRGEKALEAMKKMTASIARVIRDGQEKVITPSEIVPGDLLILEEGDRVAADARLIETVELRTSEASLTGESTPVYKSTGPVDAATQIADRRNMVFSGTHVAHGRGRGVISSTGPLTEFGKIAEMVQEAKDASTPLQKKMDRFSKNIAKVVLAVSTLIFLLLVFNLRAGGEIQHAISGAFMTAVALAISAVPEGLPAITAVTLALGARALMRRQAIIRRLSSAETLGSVTVICSDKTGTLTKGEMTVRQIYMNKRVFDVSGSGYYPKGEFQLDGFPLSHYDKGALEPLLRIGALCNNARLVKQDDSNLWRVLGDPTEGALIVAALKAGLGKDELERNFSRVSEIPFSSERKIMTTVHRLGEGEHVAYVKGAPEVIVGKSSHLYWEGREAVLTDTERREVLAVNEMMAGHALRILAMAYKRLPSKFEPSDTEIEENLIFVGLQGILDPPRPEAIEANQRCERAGIKTVMITGDHRLTATAVGEEIGILKRGDLVLTGAELDEMSDPRLEEIVERVSVYARVSPVHKQRIVRALKARGHVVAMTGDGVNDAPAIKNADIGIAMGITGTDVTKEASHMVLADDNFATIVGAVEHGRVIFDNIRKYTRFLIAANFDELFLLITFVLAGLPMPLLPAMILWINLVTDGGPAVALSIDPPEEDVMDRPPRNPREGILHGMVSYIIATFSIMSMGSIIVFLFETWPHVSIGLSIPEEALTKARTAVFAQSVLFELFVVWNCRSEKRSILRMSPLKNKYLLLSVLISFAATASLFYIPVLQSAFHVAPLTLSDWILVCSVASMGLLILPKVFYGRRIWRWI